MGLIVFFSSLLCRIVRDRRSFSAPGRLNYYRDRLNGKKRWGIFLKVWKRGQNFLRVQLRGVVGVSGNLNFIILPIQSSFDSNHAPIPTTPYFVLVE